MSGPRHHLQPDRLCMGAVNVAIIALASYFVVMWHGWLPSLRGAGIGIGAYCALVAVWHFYDLVIRAQQGWRAAFGSLALVVAGLGAYVMGFQH